MVGTTVGLPPLGSQLEPVDVFLDVQVLPGELRVALELFLGCCAPTSRTDLLDSANGILLYVYVGGSMSSCHLNRLNFSFLINLFQLK